jgi:hypothetical protein
LFFLKLLPEAMTGIGISINNASKTSIIPIGAKSAVHNNKLLPEETPTSNDFLYKIQNDSKYRKKKRNNTNLIEKIYSQKPRRYSDSG